MGYLFDTDAISETLRKKPLPAYLQWLESISRKEQYTSAVVIAELYKGAFRSSLWALPKKCPIDSVIVPRNAHPTKAIALRIIHHRAH